MKSILQELFDGDIYPDELIVPKTPNTTRLTRKSVMNRSISKRNYQWDLARLSPNEYYEYLKTGVYPLY